MVPWGERFFITPLDDGTTIGYYDFSHNELWFLLCGVSILILLTELVLIGFLFDLKNE